MTRDRQVGRIHPDYHGPPPARVEKRHTWGGGDPEGCRTCADCGLYARKVWDGWRLIPPGSTAWTYRSFMPVCEPATTAQPAWLEHLPPPAPRTTEPRIPLPIAWWFYWILTMEQAYRLQCYGDPLVDPNGDG